VKGAARGNLGAVEGPKRAVNSGESSREGLARPGNPGVNPWVGQSITSDNHAIMWSTHTKKSLATFLPVFEKSAKNLAAVSSGRWDFYGATFVFCGRNFVQLATLPPHGGEQKGARTPAPEGSLLMTFSSISAVCMIKRIANENPEVGS
jgi:hypothetical protein